MIPYRNGDGFGLGNDRELRDRKVFVGLFLGERPDHIDLLASVAVRG